LAVAEERARMDFETIRIGLGWNVERKVQLELLTSGDGDAALVAARVAVEHRGAYGLLGCDVDAARPAGRLRQDGDVWPAVGDWVAVARAPGGGDGVIHHVLPRASVLERKRPGANQAQVVAANVDVVFAVTTAERPPNLRRVERTLALIAAGGARPAVILNKVDLARDAAADLHVLTAVSGGAPCLATSAATGAGIDALRALLPPGATGAMLGPSGAGKSSLVNALLGADRLATGVVRLTDAKGRHTTTRRELLELPGGGCLIDTPGMRELGLWDAGEGIDRAFGEVAELAAACRYRDCQHRGEPGCAVAAALDSGALDAARFASFDKLRREDAFQERQHDPRSAAASKGRWKTIHKQQRARRRVDPKLRDD
jgi:ribosome biogenesis GTPase / thiamine phosphate phosphatase